ESVLQEIEEFVEGALEELRKGHNHASNGDNILLSHSMSKFHTIADQLQHLIQHAPDEMKHQLSRLASFVDNFINDHINYHHPEEVQEATASCYVKKNMSAGGRPSLEVDQEFMDNCAKSGLSITATCAVLGISRQTFYRNYSTQTYRSEEIDDEELLQTVVDLKEENRKCGARYVKGHLTAIGKTAPRQKIRETLRAVDPVGTVFRQRLKTKRKKFYVPGPNHLWSMDGNEKLNMYSFYIHGCVDAYSRKAIYIKCATNKKSTTVLQFFKEAVQGYGFPKVVRSDKGLENVKVATFMLQSRGVDSHCFITGRSVHNQRIERFWGEVNKVSLRFKNFFSNLCLQGILNVGNEVHMLALAYIFKPRIQRSLDQFLQQWNHHPLSTENNMTPNALYLTGNRAVVSLVDREDEDIDLPNGSEQSDDDDDDDDDIANDVNFQQLAQTIVPNPLLDDGSDGLNGFLSLVQSFN
ncbi:unnamed protein product, partial [Bemisia tabaci]